MKQNDPLQSTVQMGRITFSAGTSPVSDALPKRAVRKKQPPTCTWTEDADGLWISTCGLAQFQFNDDGPLANGFKWCPYCGAGIMETVEVPPEPGEDDV